MHHNINSSFRHLLAQLSPQLHHIHHPNVSTLLNPSKSFRYRKIMSASPTKQFLPRFAPRSTAARGAAAPYPASQPNQPTEPSVPDAASAELNRGNGSAEVANGPDRATVASEAANWAGDPAPKPTRPEINSGSINPALTDKEQEEPATPLRVLPLPPPPAHAGEDAATIQQLGQYLRLPEIQIENIQRTATLVGKDHWLATLMYLEWIRYRLEQTGSIGPTEVGPIPQVSRRFAFHPDVRLSNFIRIKIQESLIMSDLQAYGQTVTVANRALIPRTPLVLVKASIDAMTAKWKAQYMPPGYLVPDNEAITRVRNLIRELLKYEKSALAKLILTGARPGRRANPEPIPRIDDLTVKRQANRTTTQPHSPWEAIDQHMEAMRSKPADYKVAFARLVISYDSHLFDGTATAADISGVAVTLPSDDEVHEMMLRRRQAPPTANEEDVAPGSIF
ncbi:hypothetical protein PTTG_30125 [Puccinia triticina 1-1 BBBD Race 1]|uniref:Uncharacterized protein n=1 Tax=Puccinia triticina (isolate 1-1 / race 1 (BBBD)) TaxID=630390 RepID=A0A180G0A9_PUCT1|nr:hypothetical protein PTTG_30125 [Puccinia triticina 1-1 BBBD Race 1]